MPSRLQRAWVVELLLILVSRKNKLEVKRHSLRRLRKRKRQRIKLLVAPQVVLMVVKLRPQMQGRPKPKPSLRQLQLRLAGNTIRVPWLTTSRIS